ncbi:hypothetical protein BHE74_00006880, partial [Ensete ventricosum]
VRTARRQPRHSCGVLSFGLPHCVPASSSGRPKSWDDPPTSVWIAVSAEPRPLTGGTLDTPGPADPTASISAPPTGAAHPRRPRTPNSRQLGVSLPTNHGKPCRDAMAGRRCSVSVADPTKGLTLHGNTTVWPQIHAVQGDMPKCP